MSWEDRRVPPRTTAAPPSYATARVDRGVPASDGAAGRGLGGYSGGTGGSFEYRSPCVLSVIHSLSCSSMLVPLPTRFALPVLPQNSGRGAEQDAERAPKGGNFIRRSQLKPGGRGHSPGNAPPITTVTTTTTTTNRHPEKYPPRSEGNWFTGSCSTAFVWNYSPLAFSLLSLSFNLHPTFGNYTVVSFDFRDYLVLLENKIG